MTKIVNLDQLETRRDKVIILGGVEHVMKTLTIKEYIEQMKASTEINQMALDNSMENAEKIFSLSIEALMKAFPTVTKDQFNSLNLDQITAIRNLVEAENEGELEDVTEASGEELGKAE